LANSDWSRLAGQMHFGRFHVCGSVWRRIFDMSIAARCGRRSKPIQPGGRPFSQDPTPLPPANRFERRAIKLPGRGMRKWCGCSSNGARDWIGRTFSGVPRQPIGRNMQAKQKSRNIYVARLRVRSGNKTAFSHTSIVRFMLPAQPLDAIS
jgi:hypothetical protein